jgi:hypothetical protein
VCALHSVVDLLYSHPVTSDCRLHLSRQLCWLENSPSTVQPFRILVSPGPLQTPIFQAPSGWSRDTILHYKVFHIPYLPIQLHLLYTSDFTTNCLEATGRDVEPFPEKVSR